MDEPRTLRTHPENPSHVSFPAFRSLGEKPRSALERALSIFADVRAGEGLGAVLLAVNVFLLLATYYLLKTVREALIITESGAEVKAYSSAAQAVVLIGVVPLYGWLSTKVARIRLIGITSVFFAVNLVLFAVGGFAGLREGVVFYIWLGIFNVFAVSQFWQFANDLYTEGQGRRLFPFIGVGSSLGAWLGAMAAVSLVATFQFTPYTIMLIAAALLLVCLVITIVVNAREQRVAEPAVAKMAETPLGKEGAFSLIVKNRYLLYIAILTVLLNIVNTSGEFILSKFVESEATVRFATDEARKQFVGAFYGSFFGWVNLLGLVLQLFVTSRVMKIMGVRGALFILPVIALVNYSVLAVAPLLAVVRITKILENSTDYSIQNTIRQVLYLPTSREAKYKAKTAIDTFGTRMGDVIQAGIVRAGSAIGASVTAFAWLNIILTVIWLIVAGQIAREHRKQTV